MAGRRNKKSGGKGSSHRTGGKRRGGAPGTPRPDDPLALDGLVATALNGADELLTLDDPLEAEQWASVVLGLFYKMPVPFEIQQEVDRTLGPRLVQAAERMRNARGLAVLCALAAVTGNAYGARDAAARMAARGVPRPRWASVIGTAEYSGGWLVADPFGDQTAYYLTFTYPGHGPHMVMALYDENLGGIIKDAFVARQREGGDPRSMLEADPDVAVLDADPAEAAARIRHGVASGDLFIDHDWTEEYKHTRALLLARMDLLPEVEWPEPEPPGDDEQEELIQEFLASALAPERDETLSIVDHAVTSRCMFGDGDPLRWSPTVVELFLLDYLPRKVSLSDAEVEAVPVVLEAFVRYALAKRGLEQRFVDETASAVHDFTPAFREAMSDGSTFGPAKRLTQALRADGVDLLDQDAVDAWMKAFDARSDDERRDFFGRSLDA